MAIIDKKVGNKTMKWDTDLGGPLIEVPTQAEYKLESDPSLTPETEDVSLSEPDQLDHQAYTDTSQLPQVGTLVVTPAGDPTQTTTVAPVKPKAATKSTKNV